MKIIRENVYSVIYSPEDCTYEVTERYITQSIEEAITMCKVENKGCFIRGVRFLFSAGRKSTKTIEV